ncbi:Inositol 2-dehydrogenase/D-chiro-inositol 3-dehydrogenase [Anatilimnocola aggregata]|uniref:Inositol 2-dehydrogenase/D-chiro-inositol 3-dehydrogenase n=1 Tax=Anatilimnocola aggregata TaxID=2528021 RepID=A0A517YLN7_9BACT|nr:Gfo/Idh/MocA family oxidoreductase [Anatilimnocola aggregata]QDU31118.1 Inositol 2-dehydrogenase/D-chiro-inositol 3-dehydrogenase [Anatilimnocola aggregata]
MNDAPQIANSNSDSRRTFLKTSGTLAAATALSGAMVPRVHAAGSDVVQVALVGCGGRGTGAAQNALGVKIGQTKLVAMADVFENRLNISHQSLKKANGEKFDVPDDRKFIGFDGYKQAIDCLKPGDVAIFATPPAFRWVHFKYAIEKGVNVFMEKPITVDGPSTRKMLALGEESVKKNLKVGVGLMCRHCEARGELFDRIQAGEMGDLITLRCYRMHPPVGSAFSDPKPADMNELDYQIQRFHSFLWASGGLFSDFYIHNIDECCWMKNAWPVKAQAVGGRNYRGNKIDQNFDSYAVEYTFEDGAKLFMNGRVMPGCHDEFASYAHGSKGAAVISQSSHSPARCKIYKGQNMTKENLIWSFNRPEPNPYALEWEHLIDAILNDKPHNEVKRGAEASLVTSMGRMAAHTGQVVTFDEILKSEHEFAPDVDKLTKGGEAPIKANAEGKYPIPMPGLVTDREYS